MTLKNSPTLIEFKDRTRKTIDFQSLRLNCSDITQVNIEMRNVNHC